MLRKTRWTTLAVAVPALLLGCGDGDGGTDPILPPSAPAAPAITQSGDALVITWSPVTGATSYDVQRQDVTAAGSFSALAGDLATTNHTDNTVAVDVQYAYRVVAKNEGGSSTPSDPTPGKVGAKRANLSGTITGVRTLSADTTYTLVGVVLVNDGGRLNIPAGTKLYGSLEVQPTALIVKQGGQIYSEGTVDKPVVFTSPATSPKKGDWGGVVLNGRSICNFPADDCVGEGLAGPYGGNVPNDNSGRIVYTRIEWAGFEVSFGNELNALTLNGVGSGTEIHHVQTHGGLDDGFEWFGGTVDAKYLLATDISDDSFDFSTGWHGRGQFWIAQHDPNDADAGYEVDGNEDNYNATPWTNPMVYNVTLVGKGANWQGGTAGESTRGIQIRRGTAGTYANHIVLGFGTEGLDIDNNETVARIAADSLKITSSILFSNAVNFSTDSDGVDDEGIFLTAGWGNRVVDPQLTRPFDRANPDFRPAAGSPAMNGFATAPNDGWFSTANFIGAIAAGATEWYKEKWTRWGG